uniref:Uncharacterized protein n=1 Tax=Eutreptiella gymnastica TaxID=73025 RepID=A0A7S4D1I2_9EUGL
MPVCVFMLAIVFRQNYPILIRFLPLVRGETAGLGRSMISFLPELGTTQGGYNETTAATITIVNSLSLQQAALEQWKSRHQDSRARRVALPETHSSDTCVRARTTQSD